MNLHNIGSSDLILEFLRTRFNTTYNFQRVGKEIHYTYGLQPDGPISVISEIMVSTYRYDAELWNKNGRPANGR